jgi:hypothetical protein
MSKTLIMHESFKQGLGLIGFCYSNPGGTLLITGESGVGKTQLVYESINRLEKKDTQKTILFAHVPVPFKISYFLSNLLKNAGDIGYDKGNFQDKKQRLISFIKDTGIRLMVIDDFQHILNRRSLTSDVVGMLKEILNKTGISLVTVALPEIYAISDSLEGLIQREFCLEKIPYRTKQEVESFESILKIIEKKHEFEKSSDLSELSNEIYEVTQGNFAKISTLINGAAIFAKNKEESNISLKSLYYSSSQMFGIPKENPFYNRLLKEYK